MKTEIPQRRYFAGVLVGLGTAYLWSLIVFSIYAANEGWLGPAVFGIAAYALLITSWFVIPLGAGVGGILPRLATEVDSPRAAFRGILLGAGCGAIAAVLACVMEQWPLISGSGEIVDFSVWWRSELSRLTFHGVSMAVLSAIVVGAWSLGINKKSNKPWDATGDNVLS